LKPSSQRHRQRLRNSLVPFGAFTSNPETEGLEFVDSYRNEYVPYSETHPEAVYNHGTRIRKSATIVRVLQDYFGTDLSLSSVLDVGCSTGIIASFLSAHTREVHGIDTDKPAIQFAKENFQKNTVRFHVGSATDIPFADNSFDIVICAHVYEHVSHPERMVAEVHRVLKLGGVFYFTAGNRINVMEPHTTGFPSFPFSPGHWHMCI
jgi:2-polyprenyl-3-methyl-5-hydroxy-6-metoxy-1,4-benzoquinol methylase